MTMGADRGVRGRLGLPGSWLRRHGSVEVALLGGPTAAPANAIPASNAKHHVERSGLPRSALRAARPQRGRCKVATAGVGQSTRTRLRRAATLETQKRGILA